LMEDFGSLADFFCDGGESTEIFSSAKAAIDAGWDFVEEHLGDAYDMSSSSASSFFFLLFSFFFECINYPV